MRRRRVGRVPAMRSTSTKPAPRLVGGHAKFKRNDAFPWTDEHVRSGRGRDLKLRGHGGTTVGTVDRVDVSDDGDELWIAWTSEQYDGASVGVEASPDRIIEFWLIPKPLGNA